MRSGWALVALLLALLGCAEVATPPDGRLIEPVVTGVQMSQATEPAQLSAQWKAPAEAAKPQRVHAGLEGPPVWLRMEFALPESGSGNGSWAVYIPYLYNGGSLWLNGAPLAAIAQTTPELHVVWHRPHLIPIPDAQLRRGPNLLLLRVTSTDPGASMKPGHLTIGPSVLLQPQYDARLFWVRTMAQTMVVACLLVGVAVSYVWWRRPSEQLYGLFGLAAVLWGLRTLMFVVEVLPLSWWPAWLLLHHASTGGLGVVLALFTKRFAGLAWPRFEAALWAYALIGPLALLIGGGRLDEWVNLVWTGGLTLVALAIAGFAACAAWVQRSGASVALLMALVMTAAAGVHDHFLAWDGSEPAVQPLTGWFSHHVFVLHHAAAILLSVMVGILTQRFVRALDYTEHLNHTLEERVAARERELRVQQVELTRLSQEQATADERQRIMQDLHDGLGSRLFTTLSRFERGDMAPGEIGQSLRECIADMRLTFEVMAPGELDLAAAFGDFRYRWDATLRDAGVVATWSIDPPASAPPPAPADTLQLLHIAQEALTNMLKHARASQVEIALGGTHHGLALTITDNGRGMPTGEVSRAARGLTSMRQRAQRMRGRLEVDSVPGRTRVSATWIAPGASDAPA